MASANSYAGVTVFAASPSDVAGERDALTRVVDELARDMADEYQIALRLLRWETDARPGVGVDAQDVINRQVPPGDIVVAIFWNRLGTATSRAASGTVEEVQLALERWRTTGNPVLIYFKSAPARLDTNSELDQRARVLAFRDELRRAGVLEGQFSTTEEFERQVRQHLRREIREWIRRRRPTQPAAPDAGNGGQYHATLVARKRTRQTIVLEAYGLHTVEISHHPKVTFDGQVIKARRTKFGWAHDAYRAEFAVTTSSRRLVGEIRFSVSDITNTVQSVAVFIDGAPVYVELA